MTETFSPYNPFEYLDDAQSIKAYLSDLLFDENPELLLCALRHAVQYYGAADIAARSGLNRESLYKIINGQRKPGFDTLHRLLVALTKEDVITA